MLRKKIYNPDSDEKTSERKIFGGNPTGIFELNDIKYQWAYNLMGDDAEQHMVPKRS